MSCGFMSSYSYLPRNGFSSSRKRDAMLSASPTPGEGLFDERFFSQPMILGGGFINLIEQSELEGQTAY